MSEDYYSLLEIDKNATEEDIKKSYKKLSLKWHPDRNPGKELEAEEMFKKINHAKNILLDPEKRRIYDNGGEEALKNGGNGNFNPFNNIFDLFNSNFFNFNNEKKREKKEIIISLTLEQVYSGHSSTKKLKIGKDCDKCKGIGKKNVKRCERCKGSGNITIIRQLGPGMISQQTGPCDSCKCKGVIGDGEENCDCEGGVCNKIISVKVEFRKGVNDNEYFQTTIEDIDFYFIAMIEPHQIYKRNGNDISLLQNINLYESLTGVEFVIKLLDDREVKIKSEKVVIPEEIYTIKNLGISGGDLKIKFKINFPERLRKEEGTLGDILGMSGNKVERDLEVYYI